MDKHSYRQLFTAVVSVQKCFSRCYLEITNTIVDVQRAEPQFSVACVAFGSSYCVNKWRRVEFTPLGGEHLFKNNCEFN